MTIKNPKTIVFIGPSATGKTFMAQELMNKYSQQFSYAKLYTTRSQRDNEYLPDRIFVSEKVFEKMISNNAFLVHDEFGGNKYGFTKEAIVPNNKHLLVNAWPKLTTKFSLFDHVIFIGMQAAEDWEDLLSKRMIKRGDSQEAITLRKTLIKKDIRDLSKLEVIINEHGKMFTISNNDTVYKEIIPWIEKRLKLQKE